MLSLVQIVACHLFGTEPLNEPMVMYYQLYNKNKIQWNFIRNSKIFIQKN